MAVWLENTRSHRPQCGKCVPQNSGGRDWPELAIDEPLDRGREGVNHVTQKITKHEKGEKPTIKCCLPLCIIRFNIFKNTWSHRLHWNWWSFGRKGVNHVTQKITKHEKRGKPMIKCCLLLCIIRFHIFENTWSHWLHWNWWSIVREGVNHVTQKITQHEKGKREEATNFGEGLYTDKAWQTKHPYELCLA